MRLRANHSNGINVRARDETRATRAGDAREDSCASSNIQYRHPRPFTAQQVHRGGA
jgi:hypothetical protein